MAGHATFTVEVLTPEGEVFAGDVEMVSTRTETGSIGIRANHAPLLGMLAPAELRLYADGEEQPPTRFAQGEGYVQIAEGKVLILTEEAIKPEDLDTADLQAKLDKANAAFDAAEPQSEAQKNAIRDRRRWEMFLSVASGDAQ
ncbi:MULTISPECIES: ATP synthase F1 subunit epsilon [Solirubrobacterales]|uniref:ATP synthase F1 subunit epsilon n=1 Tax=Solirubrobacterales TaxID=588673 RepID=UPI001304FD8B|nr:MULTISPECIES: ATP synthase F1 subunit epsilon [Solirubrobacterales]